MKTYTQFCEDLEQRRKYLIQRQKKQRSEAQNRITAYQQAQQESREKKRRRAQEKEQLKKEIKRELGRH